MNMASPSMAKWSGHWGTMLATPTKRDWRSGKASEATMQRNSRPLNEQVNMLLTPTKISGQAAHATRTLLGTSLPSNARPAREESSGTAALLAISEWLQGYPPGWLARAWPPMATPSSRRSQKPSATPSGEPTKP